MSSNTRWLFQLRALPQAALAMAACAGVSSALAQNVDNGKALYRMSVNFGGGSFVSCEDCHGPAYIFKAASSAGAIAGAIANNARTGMGAYSFLTPPQLTDIAAYVGSAVAPPPPPPFASPPGGSPPPMTPMASPNPAMLPNTAVGSTSGVLNLQFTNTGSSNVAFNTPAIGAADGDAAEFLVAAPTVGTDQCINGRVMAPGTSCWFGVQFKPSTAGVRSATWTMNFIAGVAPRTVTLQGTASAAPATAPAPAPAPAANAPTSGGGGALDWIALSGLGALAGAARRRAERQFSACGARRGPADAPLRRAATR